MTSHMENPPDNYVTVKIGGQPIMDKIETHLLSVLKNIIDNLKTPHSTMTNRTTRSFAVTPAGERLEKGTVRLYKLFAFLLPQKLLFEFIASFYKSGVFLLKIYDVLLEQAKLVLKKR